MRLEKYNGADVRLEKYNMSELIGEKSADVRVDKYDSADVCVDKYKVLSARKVPFEGVWDDDIPNWDDDVPKKTPNQKYLDSSKECKLPTFVQLLEDIVLKTRIMTEMFGKGKHVATGESKEIPWPSNLKYIKEERLREETRIIPCKDELVGVTDGCLDRSTYNDVNLPYSFNILILGADGSFLDEDKNNQIIKDAPWRLIVGYDYPNLNEYKVKLQKQFNEAWFAGARERYHEKFNPISIMKCNVKW